MLYIEYDVRKLKWRIRHTEAGYKIWPHDGSLLTCRNIARILAREQETKVVMFNRWGAISEIIDYTNLPKARNLIPNWDKKP